MKAGWGPGRKLRAKGAGENLGILADAEEVAIVRYDGEGFYICKRSRGSLIVVHEDDVELVR